jgi:site-specific DNA-cytosine methylase
MLRAIQEISPRYIVGENVRGLLNWNGGMVFDEVCVELENIGYQVAPVVIPACGVGAPHTRERIWFVAANPARKSSERLQFKQRKNSNEKQREFGRNCGELLPTPNHQMYKTSGLNSKSWEKRISENRQKDLNMVIYQKTGMTSQLNPRFVAEMMGFPSNWTELPFQDGELNQSKHTATQ